MFNIYKKYLCGLMLVVFALCSSDKATSQVIKNFKQRTSSKVPEPYKNKTIYSLQGDFKMIGNTNLTLVKTQSIEQGSNAGTMRYVDVDNDPTTVNSSSSTLEFDNNDCSEIIYAGLYWTGRAHDIDRRDTSISPTEFNIERFQNEEWYTAAHNSFEPPLNGYSMSITRAGVFGSYYPQYNLNLNGTQLTIRYQGGGVTYRIGTSGSFTTAQGSSFNVGNNVNIYSFYNPIKVGDIEIYQLRKDNRSDQSESVYRNIENNNIRLKVSTGSRTNKTLNKRKVKLKKEGNSYIEVIANENDIHFPTTEHGVMFSAYADVTDYVRSQGTGNYLVADLALREGNGGSTGYYGGWGMVVIYKDTSKKWRDITVFDGHGYMTSNGADLVLNVAGFKAAQNGPIGVTLGVMAGEGDRDIRGDFFSIKRSNSNTYDRLTSDGNFINDFQDTDFFNSSIKTGGNSRNPNFDNNTGLDIHRFDIDNQYQGYNRYIANNATTTSFKTGTNGDTYIIYNIVLAVDAYVPEIVGENKPKEIDGTTPITGGTIIPGQDLEFELDIYNKGEEAVKQTRIEIPVPYNLHFVSANITEYLSALGSVYWEHPSGETDPSLITGGKIIWEIGDLPFDSSKSQLLGQLKYRLKVSNDCVLLTTANGNCSLEVRINGKITGKGAISNTAVSSDLVQGYGEGLCAGPIYDDFESLITISAEFIESCNPPVENGIMQFKAFCSLPDNLFKRDVITQEYPPNTKFFDQNPESYESNTGLVQGDFTVSSVSEQKTSYYAVVPGMEPGCYLKLETSLETVTSSPTVKNIEICFGEELVLEVELSDIGKLKGYDLFYFDGNLNPLNAPPVYSKVGVYTVYVAEGKSLNGVNCQGPKMSFSITINELPKVDKLVEDLVMCENNDGVLFLQTEGANGFVWEYSTSASPAIWNSLSNTSFSNGQIAISNEKLILSHVTTELHGVKVRLHVDNGKCIDVSNEIEIKIRSCNGITNPVLPNKAR